MDQAWLDELSELLRIPSVSADPVHATARARSGGVGRGVHSSCRRHAEVQPGDTHPLVVGEIRASEGTADAPTILVYGHFDVQPPAPLELWESEPFEATVRGEWLYARGVADDKGQLWTLLKGAELLATEGRLPVNLRFACDGEEEVGGRAIVDFLEQDERGADACIIFDSSMERRGVPAVCTATRGVMSFQLVVRTGERDLHSGMYGNAALNATHALAWALGGILPRDGRLPDALREGAQDADRRGARELERADAGRRRAARGRARCRTTRAAADDFYLRTTAGPSVDVNGILGGKPGLANTTIPVAAQANFSVRIAPGQDVETIRAAVDRLVRESAPDGADVSLELVGFAPPGLVSPDEPAVQIALEAFEHVIGAAAAARPQRRHAPDRPSAGRPGDPDDPQRDRATRVEHPLAERARSPRVPAARRRVGARAVHPPGHAAVAAPSPRAMTGVRPLPWPQRPGPTDRRPDARSGPGRWVVHPAAAGHRGHDLTAVEVLDRIGREDDAVGDEAGQEPAAQPLVAAQPRGRDARRLQRLLDGERLLRMPRWPLVDRSQTPARIPASGSSSSIGASEPFATTAPDSQSERNAYARSTRSGQ